MKKVILSLAIILSTSTFLFANDKEEKTLSKNVDNIVITEDQQIDGVSIFYRPAKSKVAQLRIIGESGDLLHSTKFNSKKYKVKKYGLDLTDQQYKIEIEDQNSIYSKLFERSNGEIVASDGPIISAKKNNNQVVEIFVQNHKVKNPVHVKIYDAENHLVHQDHITSNQSFTRNYNISQLRPGKIRFEIREGQNTVSKTF